MTTVYQRDRGRFRLVVTAYVLSTAGAVAAIALAGSAVVRPPAVIVLDQHRRVRIITDTARPPVTRDIVEAFAGHFAAAVAVDHARKAEAQRETALSMMGVALADYERAPPQAKAAAAHIDMLKTNDVRGRLLTAARECTERVPQQWTCIVRGEAEYRVGASTAVNGRRFVVQLQVESLRVTQRSPYGLLVNAFRVHRVPEVAQGTTSPATAFDRPSGPANAAGGREN